VRAGAGSGTLRQMRETVQKITVDGMTLRARIVRKRVRNVNATLVGNELRVSAPPGVQRVELDAMVRRLARMLVRRARAEVLNADDRALAVARKVAEKFPKPPRVRSVRFVTTQRSRWGSYSPGTGLMRLHGSLRQLPAWVLEAVVAHELAHSFYADHSAAFWKLAREACPATDRANAFLEGVSWISERWERLPPVERALLAGS